MEQENIGSNDTSKESKKEELNRLIRLYDTAIERQKHMVDKASKGKLKSASVPDAMLKALAVGDLNLLISQKEKVYEEIESLEKELTYGVSN